MRWHKYKNRVYWYCPGCKAAHCVEIDRWSWNGSMDCPTLEPSILNYYRHPDTGEQVTTCHCFVRNGHIEFCTDCPHPLAGTTVLLPEFPESYGLPVEE